LGANNANEFLQFALLGILIRVIGDYSFIRVIRFLFVLLVITIVILAHGVDYKNSKNY